jgi:hypothetical protein
MAHGEIGLTIQTVERGSGKALGRPPATYSHVGCKKPRRLRPCSGFGFPAHGAWR